MIKERDVVMTEKGKVAVVEIIHGDVAGVRLYNSNVRLIVGLMACVATSGSTTNE